MPIIRLAGTTFELYRFPPHLFDEFIPIIEFDNTRFESVYGTITTDSTEVTLSRWLDKDYRTFKPTVINTQSRIIKIPFNVKKAALVSLDKDGILDIKLSVTSSDIKLVGKNSLKAGYESSFEFEVEVKSKDSIECYIDFYARDDSDEELNKGELKDVHCGRIKIAFTYTVITDWATVATVIPKSKFVGWNYPVTWLPSGKEAECFDYALEQLRQVGHWVKSERWNKKWDGTKELNDYIYQLYLEQDVAGMEKGVQKDQFVKGVEYLKETIMNGTPVLVGVDNGFEVTNDDKTTEHFIVLVGMGEDDGGKYFLFYDNAVVHTEEDIGASPDNKLYCRPSKYMIEGKGDTGNTYIQGTTKGEYIVTQIREAK